MGGGDLPEQQQRWRGRYLQLPRVPALQRRVRRPGSRSGRTHQTAFTAPDETVPTNPEKNIPGEHASDPIHRLYHDTQRRDRNRAIAVAACREYFGDDYAEGGFECDEFPFASTYQGCAEPRYADGGYDPGRPADNCSALPLPGEDNQAAGRMLAQFYDKERVIDGFDDAFIVQID